MTRFLVGVILLFSAGVLGPAAGFLYVVYSFFGIVMSVDGIIGMMLNERL